MEGLTDTDQAVRRVRPDQAVDVNQPAHQRILALCPGKSQSHALPRAGRYLPLGLAGVLREMRTAGSARYAPGPRLAGHRSRGKSASSR